MKSEGIIKVITIHPLGIMNVCAKTHNKSPKSCQDISPKDKTYYPHCDATEKVSRIHPLVTMNVNPTNICYSISVWTKVVDPLIVIHIATLPAQKHVLGVLTRQIQV